MQFFVALVCHFSLLLCTSATNNNGDANNAQNAHIGSDRTFVKRHSGLNMFAFASLRRVRYFSPQAQWFMQFFAALVCHFSLLLCTSAANKNCDANNAQHAHFGSDHTFVDRHSGFNNFLLRSLVTFRYFCAPARQTTMARRDTVKTHTSAQTALLSKWHTGFNIFLRVAFVSGRPKKGRDPDLAAEGFKNTLFVNEFLIGRAEPDFWTRSLDRGLKGQFRFRSARVGADF